MTTSHGSSWIRGATLALGLSFGTAASAGETLESPTQPARLYTNRDLEKLAETPGVTVQQPLVVVDEEAWARVADFLDREHARLAAERAYELSRRRLEIEAEPEKAGYALAYAGFSYPGWIGRPRLPCPPYHALRPRHAQPCPVRR